jgi:hypothetical protein
LVCWPSCTVESAGALLFGSPVEAGVPELDELF